MGSVQPLREFIRQRLTAAAEEIFSEVEKTIIQYEEEINRQRLLDISWRPRISSQSAGSVLIQLIPLILCVRRKILLLSCNPAARREALAGISSKPKNICR
ncbi:PREDICTED: uncharacterized protein LOC107100190 isoform X2 [Cyprinodon variegatus]|uniref:uncharacterized protein LOC107100190 isoform X2 n=1 Tax=Cyprinodon variegatus TaxID=28743 RepID=UPI0007426017|nr:PREDICTED: uncharacterized protein LOC107100190 isoform X2 [Cyprinodon variegatus]